MDSLLIESFGVAQRGNHRRRWFQSKDEDLIVWYAADGSIAGFQLCYDRSGQERALTWFRGEGYSHRKVDDGEVDPLTPKRTPILVPDGLFDARSALERFLVSGAKLPLDVFQIVKDKLEQHSS